MPWRIGLSPLIAALLLWILSSPFLLGRAPTPDDRLAEIEAAYAEGSTQRSLDLCREAVDLLEGDARARCIALWALSAESRNEHQELRALYEREIDRVLFPHRAILAQTEGRARARLWGGWEKLEPLERALALWEESGPAFHAEWCSTAFELIEGISVNWQHDIPAEEWEKQAVPDDPEKRNKAYEAWRRGRGLAEDRRRWERTERLFAGIIELAPGSEPRARALLERGMRRLIAIGAVPGIDPLRSLEVGRLIEELRSQPEGETEAAALEEWHARAQVSITDWRTLIGELPNDGRADDAAFLIAWALETQLGELVAAEREYRALLRQYPESPWSSDALGRAEAIVREGIALVDRPRVFPVGTAPLIEFEARNVSQLAISLWRIPDYLDRVEGERALDTEPVSLVSGAPERTWRIETHCEANHKSKRVAIELPTDAAGAYRVRVEGVTSSVDVPVFISGLALHVEGGSDDALAWLVGGSDGRPVAGGEVLLRLDIRRRQERRSWTTRLVTDADGLVRWRYPERFIPLLEDGWNLDRLSAVARSGDEISPAPGFAPRFDAGRRPRLYTYLETDRPVYRPGQTVHFKVTVRHWDGERYANPERKTEIELRFLDPQGTPLLERTARVDQEGVLSGDFTLSSEVTLGMCTLHASHAGSEIPPRNWQRAAFRVEEYRRPEFEVAIDAPGGTVLYGDPLTVTVRGNFLSGEPVRGGKVRIRVQRSPHRFAYQPPKPYPWRTDRSDRGGWGREDVFSGDAALDGEGIAEFEIPTMERGDGLDSRYHVEAWLTDASEREESAVASFPITTTALFAHLEPQHQLIAPSEPIEIKVRAMDADEGGHSAVGEIEIARRVDREELRDGALVPVIDWEPLRTVPFRVESGGGIFREVAEEEGELRFTFRARDDRGKEFEGSCQLWVVGPGFTGRDYRLDGLQLVTSTPIARIGDEARLAVVTERPDATILVLRSAAGRVLGLDVVEAKGQVAQLRFSVRDAESPNFYVQVYAVWDGTLHSAQTEIAVPPDPYFLTGTLTAAAEEILPGEELALDLTLTDPEGRPVAGSWSLTLFDRALLSIQPEITVTPAQHFYERRFGRTMRSGSSLGWRSQGSFSWFADEEPPNRPTHPLPDLLQRMWQRRFSFLAESFFPDGTRQFFGAEVPGEAGSIETATRSAPASLAAEPPPSRKSRGRAAGAERILSDDDGGAQLAPVRIRQNFAETAAWESNFRTDERGRGTLRVTMPDSLTAWRGIARGIDGEGRTFEARVEVRTRRNIRLRLAAPRFLREGDQVVLSLVASNQFDETVKGQISLDYPTVQLASLSASVPVAQREAGRAVVTVEVEIPAEGETTVDLPFAVGSPGEAPLIALLATPRESDGLERILPVLPYGLDRYLGRAGVAADADGFTTDGWGFAVPEESDPASRSLVIDLTPSPAIALIESLPYLVQYPYGCVEQTLNRFVPALVVAETLKRTGVDLAEILPDRSAEFPIGFWGHLAERPLELFHPEDLAHLLSVGQAKLRQAQNGDGSWGWWHGYDGDPYITALVVEHLCTAREVGIEVDWSVIDAGTRWLQRHVLGRDLAGELEIYERPGLEELVWVARALLHAGKLGRIPIEDDSDGLTPLLEFLYGVRARVGDQSKALLALALHDSGLPENSGRARVMIQNLGAERFGVVFFGRNDALAWYDHRVESTAWAVRAMLAIAPDDFRIAPTVRWLIENRAGNHYDSTRSTATVALALTEYLRQTGELDCDLQAEIFVDGNPVGSYAVDRKSLFRSRGRIEVPAAMLESGEHRLEIRRGGRGPLYWSAGLEFYSREDPVPAGGNRVEIARRAFKLVDVKRPQQQREVIDGKPVIRTTFVWERERRPLIDGAVISTGDRILVELEVKSANEFRYVIVESPKPAGLETVAQQSGFIGGVYGYRELRDDKVAWFVSRLPEGSSTIGIELRAERPGRYRTVPATVEAMYLPHVRANSESGVIEVAGSPPR